MPKGQYNRQPRGTYNRPNYGRKNTSYSEFSSLSGGRQLSRRGAFNRRDAVKAAAGVFTPAAIQAGKNAIVYMTRREKAKYSKEKNKYKGHNREVFSDSVGSFEKDYKLSLDHIRDILFPVIRENFIEQNEQLNWSYGQQKVAIYAHMDVPKVEEMIKKGRDNNISVTTNLSEANDAENITLNYIGGYQKHTFVNNSNQTSIMYLYTISPRRYTRRNPKATWDEELDKNEPLGANVPLDVNPSTGGFPGSNYPFRQQHYIMKHYFTKLAMKKVILEPGQQYIHTVYRKPFTIGSKKLSMSLLEELGNATTEPMYGFFTNFLMVVAYSSLSTDSADSGMNYGSGAIGHVCNEQNLYRATMPHRPYQEINHGTLDTLTGTEQHIDATEAEVNAYGEA